MRCLDDFHFLGDCLFRYDELIVDLPNTERVTNFGEPFFLFLFIGSMTI